MAWIDNRTTVTFSARVEDSKNRPVDGAIVFIKGGFFSRAIRLEADGNGWCGTANLKPGKYKTWAEHGGRKTQPLRLEVKPREGSGATFRFEAR